MRVGLFQVLIIGVLLTQLFTVVCQQNEMQQEILNIPAESLGIWIGDLEGYVITDDNKTQFFHDCITSYVRPSGFMFSRTPQNCEDIKKLNIIDFLHVMDLQMTFMGDIFWRLKCTGRGQGYYLVAVGGVYQCHKFIRGNNYYNYTVSPPVDQPIKIVCPETANSDVALFKVEYKGTLKRVDAFSAEIQPSQYTCQ